MRYVYFGLLLSAVCLTGSAAFAGSDWWDTFEYADQAALEANWSATTYPGDDSQEHGVLDTTHVLSGSSSMLARQNTGADFAPHRSTSDGSTPQQGTLTMWIYDDGADIKQFDVRIYDATSTKSVSLGLRDDQVGSSTNYTYNLNGVVASTGIARSTGWHLFQFQAFASISGIRLKIDGKGWTGNLYAEMTQMSNVEIYPNFGLASDENKVWIDSAQFQLSSEADRKFSATNETQILDYSFSGNINNWTGSSGTSLTQIFDDGCQGLGGIMDAYNGVGGAFGFQGVLPSAVPRSGAYKLGFYYMNGPAERDGVNDLTVKINNQGDVNLGSGNLVPPNDWVYSYGETTGIVELTAGSTVTVDVSGTCQSLNTLTRLDHFFLLDVSTPTPTYTATNTPTATNTYTPSSGVSSFEVYE